MRLLGLYREAECSPGRHRSNDTVLLEDLGEALRREDFDVELLTLDAARRRAGEADLVFSMCQGPAALETLMAWERRGTLIVNSPIAARNTYRDRLPDVLRRAGLPFPATRLVRTDRPLEPAIAVNGGVWLKRGDVHASISADVQRISSRPELQAGIAGFADRGIPTAVVQAHCEGDEIKFYGVESGRFFHWFHSGVTRDRRFDVGALERLAADAAGALGLDVYGGDAIVGTAGDLTLIDVNDWPSFAPCREAATAAIAEMLKRRAHALRDRRALPRANQSAV